MRCVARRIFGALMICLMIMPPLASASEVKPFELSSEGSSVATRPFIPDNGKNNTEQTLPSNVVPPINPVMDAWRNLSPLSLTDHPLSQIPAVLSEEDAAKILSQYSELLDLIKKDPKLSESDAKSYTLASAEIKAFLEQRGQSDEGKQSSESIVSVVNDSVSVTSGSTSFSADPSKSTTPKTTARKTLEDVVEILARVTPTAPALGTSSMPSDGMVRQFASYVVASVRMTRESMEEDTLLPQAKSFSAGEFSSATATERPFLSAALSQPLQKNYQVLSSVVMNSENARTFELLNPPQKLHPFIRWLCYGRHLTSNRAERYLAARAKVKSIFLRAKAGEGLIRYNGKIMEGFMPLPGDETGATFELVRRM